MDGFHTDASDHKVSGISNDNTEDKTTTTTGGFTRTQMMAACIHAGYEVNCDDILCDGGSLGVVCRGTRLADKAEVAVGSLAVKAELRDVHWGQAVVTLLERRPNTVELVETFDVAEEEEERERDVVNVIFVLRLCGDNAEEALKEIFASVVSLHMDGNEEPEEEGKMNNESTTMKKSNNNDKNKKEQEEEVPSTNCNTSASVESSSQQAEEGGKATEAKKESDPNDSTRSTANKEMTSQQQQQQQSPPPPPSATASPSLLSQDGVLVVGDYIVHKNDVLGRGRFGVVYRGVHKSEGYEVAVKILKGPAAKCDKMLTEVRELNRLQCLNHPNILRMHSAYRQKETRNSEITLVLVLELCRGGDLKEFLLRHEPLSERQAKNIMRQLVDFLWFLKTQHMMHRDLKPANILLTTSNIDEAVVKVADWGMAKRISKQNTNTNNNNSNSNSGTAGESVPNEMFESAVGTVAYMSPERLSQDLYNFQAEVWALGVIMYELLFARHPYLHASSTVRTPKELLEAITRAEELDMSTHVFFTDVKKKGGGLFEPQSPKHEINPLSRECYEIMKHILHPDYKKRYTIEQVRAHPWISLPEPLRTTEEVKAVNKDDTLSATKVNEKLTTTTDAPTTTTATTTTTITTTTTTGAEAPDTTTTITATTTAAAVGIATTATLPSKGAIGSPRHVPSTEDDTGCVYFHGISSTWTPLQRQKFIYQALRDYFYILRYNVMEAENDPGRGLVLLSYAWELLCAAIKAVVMDEQHTLPEATGSLDASNPMYCTSRNYIRLAFPDDIKLMENYIQETAQRLKRNLPSFITQRPPLGADATRFSSSSMPGVETSAENTTVQSSAKLLKTMYPTAHTLLFQRAVSLIRTAATEELMLGDTSEQDNVMEEEETLPDNYRRRQQSMYEEAMAILRLILQQVVVRQSTYHHITLFGGGGGTTDPEDNNTVQVLTIPLVPLRDEADQRTVQALLHRVEKHYRRLVNIK